MENAWNTDLKAGASLAVDDQDWDPNPARTKVRPVSKPADRITLGLGLALLAIMSGCVGYVGGGYGGAVAVPGVFFYDGFNEGGPYWHAYSRRGAESRAWAHPGGGGHGGRR